MKVQAMKVQITAAALVFAVVPALAQNARMGVSNPDPAVITTTDDSAPTPVLTPRTQAAKPGAGTPAATSPGGVVYGPYVPYTGPKVASSSQVNADEGFDELPEDGSADGKIVLSVPEREGELREGTLLKTRIREDLSTASTLPGTKFTAGKAGTAAWRKR